MGGSPALNPAKVELVEKKPPRIPTVVGKHLCHAVLTADFYGPCQHKCIYCYAWSLPYLSAKWGVPEGKVAIFPDLPRRLDRFFEKYSGLKYPLRIGALSDVGPPYGRTVPLLVETLGYALRREYPVIIFTKVPLHKHGAGDAILKMADAGLIAVAVTITDFREEFYRRYEPFAPSAEERAGFLQWLADHGVPHVLRVSPLMQGVTDRAERFAEILDRCPRGHVVVEYLRVSGRRRVGRDYLRAKELVEYFKNLGVGPWDPGTWAKWNAFLAPAEYRRRGYQFLRDLAHMKGWTFAVCGDRDFMVSDYRDCCTGEADFFGRFMPYEVKLGYAKKIVELVDGILPRTPLMLWRDPYENLAEKV